jgi:hypothetical protein
MSTLDSKVRIISIEDDALYVLTTDGDRYKLFIDDQEWDNRVDAARWGATPLLQHRAAKSLVFRKLQEQGLTERTYHALDMYAEGVFREYTN